VPGLQAKDWTPRELRHSFVSVLSDAGIPVEEISQLVRHRGTTVNRAGLSVWAADGDSDRRDSHGPAFRARIVGCIIVTQLVTQV